MENKSLGAQARHPVKLKDKTSLQDDMNRALIPLGLEDWEVLWEPDSSQKVNGRVIAEQKIIIVFTEDPERAKDVFLHEVLEVKIQPLITQYQETTNGLLKIIEGLNDLDEKSQETENGFIRIVQLLIYLDKERANDINLKTGNAKNKIYETLRQAKISHHLWNIINYWNYLYLSLHKIQSSDYNPVNRS